MKPSERVPRTLEYLAELWDKVGFPKGVLNVVYGEKDLVTEICTNDKIRAISFVGSNIAGEYIYKTGCAHGKRVQSNMGAKNHGIIMPDADKNDAINQIVAASFGGNGQRCMALSYDLFVGESYSWLDEVVERTKKLKSGYGFEDNVDFGPIISKESLERIHHIIEISKKEGAKILLDGKSWYYNARCR